MKPWKPLILGILLVASGSVGASPPLEPSARFDPLSLDQGLVQSTVYATAQDSRGLIYLGTQRGVARFDGYGFVDVDPGGILDTAVSKLLVVDAHTLLVGTFSEGLARLSLDTAAVELLGRGPDGLRSHEICALAPAGPGRVWVGSGAGLDLLDLETSTVTVVELETEAPPCALLPTDDGLWIGADRLLHYAVDTGRIEPHDGPFDRILSLLEDRAGRLYVGTDRGLARRSSAEERFEILTTVDAVLSLVEDASGRVWLGTHGGARRLDPSTGRLRAFRDGPRTDVLHLMVDASGLLWLGTQAEGALRYDPSQEHFRGLPAARDGRPGSSGPLIWAVHREGDGTLFVAGDGGLDRFDGRSGAKTTFTRSSGSLSTDYPMALHRRRDGTLLVGGLGGEVDSLDVASGRVERLGTLARPDLGGHEEYVPIRGLVEDHRGEVWAASLRGGLGRGRPGEETGFETVPGPGTRLTTWTHGVGSEPTAALPEGSKWISALVESEDGTLWLGGSAGLHALSADRSTYTIFRRASEEPSAGSPSAGSPSAWMDDEVQALSRGSQGRLWLGSPRGDLASFDRETFAVRSIPWRRGRPDLAKLSVYTIVEDSRGLLWLATNGGIVRVDPATGSARRFDTRNGLLNPELNAGAWFYDRQRDEMLLGGIRGVDAFRPGDLGASGPPTPIVLTAVRSANRHLRPQLAAPSTETLELHYRDRDVLFELASVDFRDPRKHRYSYRLDGQDDEWIDAGTRRVAAYSNLPGGDYVFRVRGTVGDGRWSEEGLRLRVRVIPPYWQTTAFRLGAGGATMLGLMLLPVAWYRRRLAAEARRREEETEARRRLLAAREQERTRLARDLHDGPLQDLSGVRLHLRRAIRGSALDDTSVPFGDLDRVSSELRHVCRELRPPALVEGGLASAIETRLAAFARAHPEIELEVDLMADSRAGVSPERVQLFRIFQEALTNITKHARATWIRVRLDVDAEGDVLEIDDDGLGFVVPERLLELGRRERYGLLGMAERAELIGARFEVESNPGAGTRIRIDLPAKPEPESPPPSRRSAPAAEVLHV